jgi:hypothetical protein
VFAIGENFLSCRRKAAEENAKYQNGQTTNWMNKTHLGFSDSKKTAFMIHALLPDAAVSTELRFYLRILT